MPLWRYTETSCLCIIRFWKVNKSFKHEKESYLETNLYNPDHKSSVSQIEETDSGHVITHYLLPERSGEDSQDSLYSCLEIIQGMEVTCRHGGVAWEGPVPVGENKDTKLRRHQDWRAEGTRGDVQLLPKPSVHTVKSEPQSTKPQLLKDSGKETPGKEVCGQLLRWHLSVDHRQAAASESIKNLKVKPKVSVGPAAPSVPAQESQTQLAYLITRCLSGQMPQLWNKRFRLDWRSWLSSSLYL